MTENQSELALRLLQPADRIGVEDLAGRWFTGFVGLRARLGKRARPVDGAGLPARLRGALGEVLKGSASTRAIAGKPCPWQPACALDPLFRAQGKVTSGLELPKPLLLRAEIERDVLEVNMQFVGFASDWLEEAASAMVRAVGSRLDGIGPTEVIDRRLGSCDRIDPPPVPEAVIVAFETPLSLRFKGAAPAGFDDFWGSLASSLANRVSLMARWQDCAVATDWRAWHAHARRLEVTCLAAKGRQWQRYSNRQSRGIPMEGIDLAFMLRGDLTPLWPLLVIGEQIHVGGRTSLGQGRYRLLEA